MSLMKADFLGSAAARVFLLAVLLSVAPDLAQAQPRSHAEVQAQGDPGHTNGRNGNAQPQPETWPTFKPTTSKPLFSLYDALGRPDNFTIRGTFRSRAEGIANGFRPAPFPRDEFANMLFGSIFAEYDTGQKVKIGGELLDARSYFQKNNSVVSALDVNAFELTQAYLNFDLSDVTGDGSKSSLTAGRFTKDVGSRRYMSRQQFRNNTNAYTGVSFDWKGASKDRWTVFWTMPHIRLPDDAQGVRDNAIEFDRESPDLQFYGTSYTFANVFGGSLELFGYGLYEQDSGTGLLQSMQTRNRRLFTPGARLFRGAKPGKFDYEFEGVYQAGLARASTAVTDTRDLDVSAYFVHAETGYTFAVPWLPRLSLIYDHASGDNGNPSTFNRFDSLFGVRREYNAPSLYGPMTRANLITPAVRLYVTPSSIWDAYVAYRAIWLDSATDVFGATKLRDRSGQSGRFAGHQIEARLRYWLIPDAMLLETGAAYLFKGRFLHDVPNAPDAGDTVYGYLATQIFF